MAPEVLQGEPADARSDIWALGVMLYEMASGRRPFGGHTGFEITSSILRDSLAPLPPHVPSGLRAVIQKCLSKDRGQRYQRANEVQAAIEALGTATVPATPRFRLPGRAIALAGLVLAVVAVLLAWRALKPGPPRIQSIAVLPLDNLSRDSEQEYFADGATEALISSLAQIRALKVISRTSVMKYKGTRKGLPEIAVYLQLGRLQEVLAFEEKQLAVQGVGPAYPARAHVYALMGRRAETLKALQKFEQSPAGAGGEGNLYVAYAYAALGDKDRAFA